MIIKIRNHIRAFGDKFIVAEFGLAALLMGGVAVLFLVNGQYVPAFISAGITLNCLPMLAYGVRAWMNQEAKGNAQLDDKQTLTETLVLSAALILPFVLLAATIYEQWQENQTHTS